MFAGQAHRSGCHGLRLSYMEPEEYRSCRSWGLKGLTLRVIKSVICVIWIDNRVLAKVAVLIYLCMQSIVTHNRIRDHRFAACFETRKDLVYPQKDQTSGRTPDLYIIRLKPSPDQRELLENMR